MKQFQKDDLINLKIENHVVTAKICLVAVNGVIIEYMKQGKRCLDFIDNNKLIPA